MIRLSLFDYFFEKKIKEIRDTLTLYTYNNNNHVRSCRLDIFIKKNDCFSFPTR
jgi:hypothetical protein